MDTPRKQPLTGKQQAFVEAYLTTWNATTAAKEAGYKGAQATLAATGSRLLRNDKVKAAVSERLREKVAGTDEALARLWELANVDPGDLAEVMNGPTPAFAMMTARRRGVARFVRKIKPSARGVCVEWHDPVHILEVILRHTAPTRQEIGIGRLDVEKLSTEELRSIIKTGRLPR